MAVEASVSTWAPLRSSLFRALWLAALVSNFGIWMQNVGAAWLMTSLSHSPTLVALVQTATSLPFLVAALPAGVLGDIVDRRWLLVANQGWMATVALALGLVTLLGAMTPWLLLALTFALGMGFAALLPTWQAIQPDLVSRSELPQAITLVGVNVNVSRAIGPAVGGLLIAASGPAAVFLINAVLFFISLSACSSGGKARGTRMTFGQRHLRRLSEQDCASRATHRRLGLSWCEQRYSW